MEIKYKYLKVNENFTYYYYLQNSSNGVIINDTHTNCTLHLTDYKGKILIDNASNFSVADNYWYNDIDGKYIDEPGYYYYGVNCQNEEGGSVSGVFDVKAGDMDYEKPSLFIMILIYGFILFLLLYNDTEYKNPLQFFASILLIIGGFIFMIYDFGIINDTLRWGIIVVNWGVAFLIISKNIAVWLEGLEKM